MASATLRATPRNDTGKGVARKLRMAGQVPGVIYGHARDPQPLALDGHELSLLLDRVTASTVIDLNLGGISTKTLMREIQRHPFKKEILHVDFQELVAGEKVTVDVPLVFHGVPEGVRVGGGLLDIILHALTVKAEPSSIPDHIDVDVTDLTMGHPLHVSDLKLPVGVEAAGDAGQTVATVSAPRTAEETPVAAIEAVPEPELIRKTKADEDEK
jgi:large subunit ribosomal protein L25